MITPADLDRLEALARAATPGPWAVPVANVFRVIALRDKEAWRGIVDSPAEHYYFGQQDLAFRDNEGPEMAANAAFIAAANPSTVLRLIAECRRKPE